MLLEQLALIRKALVPLVTAGVFGFLGALGITESMTIGEAMPLLISAFLVWLIPNKK